MAITPKQWDILVGELKNPEAQRRLEQIQHEKIDNPLRCPCCNAPIKVVNEIDNYPHGLKIVLAEDETPT